MTTLPNFETIALARTDRLLTITLNRPDALNGVNEQMHKDLGEVLTFVADDPESDVLVLTGAGRAFSAGGDIAYLADNAKHPERFDIDVRRAKRIVYAILDLEKPLICKLNGHAVGLGATIALLCDVVFAADSAKIGDPHVNVGLVAGDGGAFVGGRDRCEHFVRRLPFGHLHQCLGGRARHELELEVAVEQRVARLHQ